MGNRFVRPETTTLTLANGDTLIVRTRLSHGEQRAAFARLYLSGADGAMRLNPSEVGLTLVTSYLIDWSLTDESGAPVPIRGVSMEELIATLDALDPDSFTEISDAIRAHEAAQAKLREEEKKTNAGGKDSAPTSGSPSGAAGVSTKSEPLTAMSTTF